MDPNTKGAWVGGRKIGRCERLEMYRRVMRPGEPVYPMGMEMADRLRTVFDVLPAGPTLGADFRAWHRQGGVTRRVGDHGQVLYVLAEEALRKPPAHDTEPAAPFQSGR